MFSPNLIPSQYGINMSFYATLWKKEMLIDLTQNCVALHSQVSHVALFVHSLSSDSIQSADFVSIFTNAEGRRCEHVIPAPTPQKGVLVCSN